MAFSQQRFLGATVTGFSASAGWGETASQLVVSLVEDDAIGDVFTPPTVGFPVTFQFDYFNFTGILNSWAQTGDTGGFTCEATVVDPRELLNDVQLILDGYTGGVAVYNLLNVYGYLESFGFGASRKNETGIPWRYVKNAVEAMTQGTLQGTYGGALYFLQTQYFVDLSSLPNVPDDYRVGSDSISLLNFIGEICDAGGCDYYISMVETFPGIFGIKVNTVSRTALIDYGAVTQFIVSLQEYENKSIGRELANEITSKQVVGGQVRELWYQFGDLSVATIWPFWGFDINGYPIIGTGLGNNHKFVLDSRSVNNPRVGPFYQADVAEIRAVLGGRAGWETFLLLKDGMGGIHTNKAKALGIIGYVANVGGQALLNDLIKNYTQSSPDPKLRKVELDLVKTFFPHTKDNQLDYEQLDRETGYLYDFLYHIATEYYGKKFLVNIPYAYSAVEPDTGKIRVSQFPVDSAYLSESAWPTAIQNNLVPLDVDRFSEEDGKINCYVRFDGGDLLDLSDLSPDSIGFNSRNPGFGKNKLQNYSIFVKASADERVVYLDPYTRFGPRALITLDGVVHERAVSDDFSSKKILVDFINGGFSKATDSNGKPLGIDITSPEYKKNVLDKITGHIAQDVLNYGTASTAVIPNLAVVPMESQVLRYGPWYSQGSPGKVDYEVDDSLVPWHYGGYDAMNLAAFAKVNAAIGTNQQLEQGSVTFPDVPFHNLGEPILFGGPIVSDISVSIDSAGAHTTYKFRRNVKQPRYGQAKAERVGQLARTAQKMRRNIRLAALPKRRVDTSVTSKPIIIENTKEHPKKKKTSSHEMLVGQVYKDNDGNITSSIFLQSDYNFIGHTQTDYDNKAFTSLDGIFHPYSTTRHDTLNYFVTPKTTASLPTVKELSPFQKNTNPYTKITAKDDTLSESLYGPSTNNDYRGIAFRGPLIVSGPGYTTGGVSYGNTFDASTWKTGPVDLRWDEDRGVYAAGGNEILEGTLANKLSANSTAQMNVWDKDKNTVRTITVSDAVGWTVKSGAYVIACKINENYRLLVAEC